MKRKRSDHDFLKALQTSRPSADAAFVEKLKQKLLAEAQEILPEPRVSGLALIFQSMKRYSMAYVGALVLVAFGTMMLLPRGLDPQEFLAKASETYSESGNIFYEKTLNQRFENETVQESSLEEVYYDDEGNYLRIIRNPDTQEIAQVDMTVWDENNESRKYHSPDVEEGPVTIEEGSEPDVWYETYMDSPKYYCVKTGETETITGQAFLKISQADPSVYTLDGSVEDKIQDSGEEDAQAVLSEHDLPVETVKSYLNELKNSDEYTSVLKKEGSVSYYVFEKDLADEEEPRHIAYYFNTETYKLDKQILTFANEPARQDITTYLENQSISSEQTASIFDPSKYDVVEGHWIVAGAPDYATENGCYFNGEKLSEEETQKVLDSLPTGVVSDWEKMFEEIINPVEINFDTNESEEILEEVNLDFELPENVSFVKPTEGTITQGFNTGHYGYDIANRDQPDIVAVATGTIVYASAGTYDGGYGTNIWINHGNGYKTHYANMQEIYVNVGDTVSQGQVIGKMGNSGRSYGVTGIHLHFELTYNEEKVSPSIMNVW